MQDEPPKMPPSADDLGLPKWLEMDCPECGARLGCDSVMDLGVVFTPVYRGDLAVSYLCKKCSSLIEMRYRSAVKHLNDLSYMLMGGDPPCPAKRYEDVVWEHQHGQDHSRQ